jgi:cobalt/nickel transport system permease protein
MREALRSNKLTVIYFASLVVFLTTTAMHIPDGYLSPITSIILFALVLPFWVRGIRTLREKLSAKTAPLVALFAAFSFVIMMFNVPLPGGTTGHAVGGALAAIILGPDLACIAISIALIIQAVFFGDGGILAIGANSFNMAVVLPFVASAVYHLIVKKTPIDSKKRIWASALAAYAGLSVAAFFAAVEFGIQPALFHTSDGTPLYAPYPLSVSIPAMVIPHLLVASVVEAAVTAGVVAYLLKANRSALAIAQSRSFAPEAVGFSKWRALWVGLAALIVLSPLGLLAPGTAWGEWGAEELIQLGLPSVPAGLQKLSALWSAPAPDYNVPALGNANAAYILSATVGILITVIVVWLFTMLVTTGKKPETAKATK